jgi:nitrogen fixation NifU-like protein
MYSAQVLDHFEHPRNSGELPDATVTVQVENPVCGDVLELSLRIAGGTIADARFRARGCVPTVACASRLTEMLLGKTQEEAASLSRDALVTSLGGLPAASLHASHLVFDALATVLAQRPSTGA